MTFDQALWEARLREGRAASVYWSAFRDGDEAGCLAGAARWERRWRERVAMEEARRCRAEQRSML